ncbi:hypothetical protein [Actinomadura sp. HBU206391]|nr:hypothetical protein [Actinomadura sp. HBU206391]MBC6458010.1 hypothetical protein [Actinomadura sp. HBU206391]
MVIILWNEPVEPALPTDDWRSVAGGGDVHAGRVRLPPQGWMIAAAGDGG